MPFISFCFPPPGRSFHALARVSLLRSLFSVLGIAAAALPLLPGTSVPAVSPAPSAPAPPPPPEPERFGWTGKIAAGKSLQVRNDFGDIRARYGGSEGKVEVSAVLQHLTRADPPIKVMISEAGGALVVTVGYPAATKRTSAPAAPPAAAKTDRVDLVIFVPKGTPLSANTLSGTIEAKGLQSDLNASSVTGEIWARLNGRVEARSERGAVTAFLDPGEKEPQRLETLTGDITVYLRDTADLEVEAATSGEISTDFSLVIDRHPRDEPDKRARVKIRKGGAKLSLASKRGRIRILWMPEAPGGSMIDSD